MSYLIKASVTLVVIVATISCEKDDLRNDSLASLNIINAVVDGETVKLNSNLRDSAKIFNSWLFSATAGDVPVYVYPVSDSMHPYMNMGKSVVDGGIYSMYLFGESPQKVETIWVKENFEPYYSDSSFAVRFVNVCANSTPLSFTLGSDPGKSLFKDVGIGGVTEFLKLPLSTAVAPESVTFQARTASGLLLTSYTIPVRATPIYPKVSVLLSRFRRITIVVKGAVGGASASSEIGMFPVANY